MERKPNAVKDKRYKQTSGQKKKCLQPQTLGKDRKTEFSKDDISQGAKLAICYLEPRECGQGLAVGVFLGPTRNKEKLERQG